MGRVHVVMCNYAAGIVSWICGLVDPIGLILLGDVHGV